MELNELFLSVKTDIWEEAIPTEMNDVFSPDWNFDPFYQNTPNFLTHSSCEVLSPSFERNFNNYPLDQAYDLSAVTLQNPDSFHNTLQSSPFSAYIPNLDEEEDLCALPFTAYCEIDEVRTKKLQRKPSKNLMAERRRRKRLNDRLSMLRSIVPKISKMDRTAILGDAIDYMKELSEKISYLKQEIEAGSSQFDSLGLFQNFKLNDFFVKSSPKLEVEERDGETRISICCSGKPGLLPLTVNAIEELGLEIKDCVISAFNDFTMQASCSQELKRGRMADPEEVKKALLASVGFKQSFEYLFEGGF